MVEKRNKRREFRGEQRAKPSPLFVSPLKLPVISQPLPSCETQLTRCELVYPPVPM